MKVGFTSAEDGAVSAERAFGEDPEVVENVCAESIALVWMLRCVK